MESIGSRLKEAREAKGISIQEAQKDTRIHGKVLIALENDRVKEAVSGPIYIRSFIKKYGDYLGLDGASLADEYKVDAHVPIRQVLMLRKPRSPFRFPFKKVVTFVIAVLLIYFGIKVLFFVGSKIKSNFPSRPKTTKKVEAPKPKLIPKEAAHAETQTARPVASAVDIPTQIPRGENLILTIKARGDVWLKVKSDGTVIYDGILKKGSTESWQAKQSLDISTGKAETISADLNGAALGPLGKGVLKGILITKDGLRLPK